MKVQEDSNFDLEESCWQRATLLTKQFLHEVMSPNHEKWSGFNVAPLSCQWMLVPIQQHTTPSTLLVLFGTYSLHNMPQRVLGRNNSYIGSLETGLQSSNKELGYGLVRPPRSEDQHQLGILLQVQHSCNLFHMFYNPQLPWRKVSGRSKIESPPQSIDPPTSLVQL